MSRLISSILALALVSTASAEIRLLNGTGKELKVDVLSQAAQVRDFSLPAGKALSPVLGGQLPENKSEVLVIKDANGQEIERTDAQTNCVFAINNWGRGVSLTYLGKFQGRKSDGNRVNLINTTGKVLDVALEYSDFKIHKSRTSSPDDQYSVTGSNLGSYKSPGEKARATIGGGGYPALTQEVEVGGLYMVSDQGGNLVIQRIR